MREVNKIINIAGHIIGEDTPVYIIAEAGVNHNGRLDLALKLIDIAYESGANAVKFQTYFTPDLIIQSVEKAQYQKETTSRSESQYEMLKKLEINQEFHEHIIKHCKSKGITFLSTPYDERSLELLLNLSIQAIKVASTDTTNLLFLEKIAKTGLPVLLSTGMSSIEEIELAYKTLVANGCNELALLKCTSNYPADINNVNLRGIRTLSNKFNVITGFSDHTSGIGASPFAVACGAKIIEKHFTIDKSLEGPDHKASLSPDELKKLVSEIRRIENMLGSANIQSTKSESGTKVALQKCFVARIKIKKGELFTRDNIVAKRTGGKGVPANMLYELVGKTSPKDFDVDQPIIYEDLMDEKRS